MEEHKIKRFKLRRPVILGERPAGITIPWQVFLVFCSMVIIVLGIIGWFYPWFCLPVACIAILIFLACLSRYPSHQK
jgi:hypothetical protein